MHAAARTQRPSAPLVGGAGEALCVRVRWGDHRVATHVLDAGLADDALTLGSGAGADVVLPRPGKARFSCGGDAFLFAFTDGLAGQVLRNGEVPLTLDECIARGLAKEVGDGWVMRLGHADAVRLDAGSLTVDAFHIRRPRRALGALDDVLDYRWLNVLLLCFLVGAVLLAQLSFTPVEAWDDAPRGDVTRLRHILVQPPPEPKKVAAASVASPDAPKKGTPTKDGTPKRKASPPRVGGGGGPDARALVGQAFAGLGAQGVFGGGGLGKELASAMGTMVGASDGLGGLSLRGSGAGGPGGELVGIGGIARPGKNVGAGVGLLCPPGKTCKSSPTPELDVREPVVCGGVGACLDKELIRRVIRSHLGQVRYCYEAQLNANPSLEGKVAITFHVVASGLVDDARVASSTANNAGLEACLVSRVRTWRFPADPRAGSYVITYPFIFKTAGR